LRIIAGRHAHTFDSKFIEKQLCDKIARQGCKTQLSFDHRKIQTNNPEKIARLQKKCEGRSPEVFLSL
jgi:hypothetical protein